MDNSAAFLIEDRETLKVMADPLRGQILEVLLNKPHTIKQVAGKLGLAPSKLYYQFNLLEKHGLIRVVETRMVSNLVEKHYQAVASRFELASGLLATNTDEGKANANELVVSMIDTTRDDILRSLQARYFKLEKGAPEHPRRMIFNRRLSRVSEAKAMEFQERLCGLLEEFEALDALDDSPDSLPYALTVAFYPSFYYKEDSND